MCLIACTWIWWGSWKLMHFPAFEAIVAGHGILPRIPTAMLLALPVVEIVVGVGLLATFDMTPAWRKRRVMHLLSVALIVILSTYLASVPSGIIGRTGCGCHGSPTSGLSMRSKSLALIANAVVLLLHAPLGANRVRCVIPSRG